MEFDIELLPPTTEIETKAVLKQLNAAHRYLALLNGWLSVANFSK